MRCPKCGYLGFEEVARCRNCGHDFTVSAAAVPPELPLRRSVVTLDEPLDLDLSSSDSDQDAGMPPRHTPELHPVEERNGSGRDLPLFGEMDADANPHLLISRVNPPRPPLAVRRATPEVARVRVEPSRAPMLELGDSELVAREAPTRPGAAAPLTPRPLASPSIEASRARPILLPSNEPAALGQRALAVAVDALVLGVIDAVVVYFTLKICGLTIADLRLLPKAPLLAFLVLQNGGYLAAFTAGGQTLGKMIAGIRVVSEEGAALDLGRSIKRTLVWALLAAPAGLGFITAMFDADRRGLHDRLAGTRVIRADI